MTPVPSRATVTTASSAASPHLPLPSHSRSPSLSLRLPSRRPLLSPSSAPRAGLGFHVPPSDDEEKETLASSFDTEVQHKAAFGLSARQMAVLYPEFCAAAASSAAENDMEQRISARSAYVAPLASVAAPTRKPPTASTTAPQGAPPDLPSMLLNGRIVYIGMPLVAAVTELVVAQLLWLQYDNPEKPVYLYINSGGTISEDGQQRVGFETEAYAIADTLSYIRNEIHTIAVGKCWGQAAMVLGAGDKGKRHALPNASIKLQVPRINPSQGVVSDVIIKAEEAMGNAQVYVDMLAKFCNKTAEEVWQDIDRPKYLTPKAAVDYGLIDHVMTTGDARIEKKDYDAILAAAQRAQGDILPHSGGGLHGGY